YLTATRPDIMFAVCAAARHQVTPKTSNLVSIKRIFKYLIAYPKLGLWYLRDSPFDLEAFSTVIMLCKKQTIVATSSCEAEYMATASCCGQWFLFTSAGHVTFCWLFPIPTGWNGFCWWTFISAGSSGFYSLLLVVGLSAGCSLFLLVNWFLLVICYSCWQCIFPAASEVSLPDGVKRLMATIDGTAYTVTEASIRSALQLNDLNAIDTMTNEEIFAGLQDIGYATKGKFMFFKNKFSPQWKFLIHTLIHCFSPKSAHILNQGEPAFVQAPQQKVSPPLPSPVVAPHPSPDQMPSPPRQSSPPSIPFGHAPSSRVVSTKLIPNIPSSSEPSEPVLETITSPIRDDDTGGGSFHESPPCPPPATSPRSPTVGVAEEPLTLTSLLALFPTCLQRIATLEAEIKATKIFHRDTVVLFAKRIKKLESKLKTKKRKLVLSDLENEEEARQSQELDALLHLANAALHDPNSAGGLDSAGGVVSAGGADSAEEQEWESRASAAQSTQRQAELDRVALNLTNEDWIGLVDQVWANLTLSTELLGADVSKDTFSVRMVELM
nr:hypothetical protein [Tanacetum cinerariifolium]